jgi:hypothetical protein
MDSLMLIITLNIRTECDEFKCMEFYSPCGKKAGNEDVLVCLLPLPPPPLSPLIAVPFTLVSSNCLGDWLAIIACDANLVCIYCSSFRILIIRSHNEDRMPRVKLYPNRDPSDVEPRVRFDLIVTLPRFFFFFCLCFVNHCCNHSASVRFLAF